MGIATVGFAHLAMTQYTAAPLNYNLYYYPKEMTLDRLAAYCNGRGSFHEVVGFSHLLNLCFLRIGEFG